MEDLIGKHKADALYTTCGRSAVFAAKYLKKAGLTTILVLSGETTADDVAGTARKPDYIVSSVADLIEQI